MDNKPIIFGLASNTILLFWEHWLARTERFVEGSTIELLSAAGRFILLKIKQKLFRKGNS